MDILRRMLKSDKSLLIVWILGFIFFIHNAHFQLATDDIGWLKGETPTVFDQYRLIPRLLFSLLYKIAGPSPLAALIMIFFFQSVNMLLINSLAWKLLGERAATITVMCIFMINPITLSTLTWISCFSYILGTTFALSALYFFQTGLKNSRRWLWWLLTMASYIAGLFCSHELIFIPVVFLLLGWPREERPVKGSISLFTISMSLGLLINYFFYNFGRYGVETTRLFSFEFASAFVSSAVSFGLDLGFAYLLSFFISPTNFLQFAFNEPIRWGITILSLTGTIFLYRQNRNWRNWIVLWLSFVTVITPYIIRLFLMPASVNYDISYVLSGRVFYLPFVAIAFIGGKLVYDLHQKFLLTNGLVRLLAYTSPIGAYLYALLILYNPEDFLGLSVSLGTSQSNILSWNPYRENQAIWLVNILIIAFFASIRFIYMRRNR